MVDFPLAMFDVLQLSEPKLRMATLKAIALKTRPKRKGFQRLSGDSCAKNC